MPSGRTCQSCQKHPATYTLMNVEYAEDGTPRSRPLYLCGPCAKTAGVPVPASTPSLPKLVSQLSKTFFGQQAIVSMGKDIACPHCGWTLRDFKQTSRFGCPRDYEVFGEFVNDLLEQLHGSSEHPASPADAELARLTRDLQEAVEREQYEVAARLRDRIRELEAGLEQAEDRDLDGARSRLEGRRGNT